MAKNGNGWRGFVDVALDKQHKAAIKKMAKAMAADDVFQQLVEIVTDGYKLSISNDEANQCFVVALTGQGDNDVNGGYTMSQRHSDLHVALVALLFVHVELAQRGAWDSVGSTQRAFDW